MPRVTESHRAERRAEILAAAARLFADNGFHATSMAGIIAESGLSAGAVYRYFRSKEELIGAVAEFVMSTADQVFEQLLAEEATPSPGDVTSAMVEGVAGRLIHDPVIGADMTRLAVQIWSEALRNPDVLARVSHVVVRLRGHCAEVARRWQDAGNLPADVAPDQVGAAMLSLVQGYILQRLLLPETDASYYVAGVRALLSGKT
ncbi:TetR family transcriptional regulator [Actinoplanes philippinensis]|uniref:DNA-binding transcriptional regulator, AcrR family n=1 Tax=Actinoplanes philippinensis TaxID=35752 RepID=A0A1I2N914_9ACTN|nr:TetR/AcrR family transcriptional regulator [Actinoplanes philippinensis]GIE83441.1 TetR family transcriptional regulator [Actinoplanes philippinensis]SFG00222.1 DNA-binding transcriptional regulator, AcrR family [Actinoplanes philippinensis]